MQNGVEDMDFHVRWRVAVELFSRVFMDDVGAEPGSVISDLGGFPVKETRFRREMEKLRSSQQKDLNITKVFHTFFHMCKINHIWNLSLNIL